MRFGKFILLALLVPLLEVGFTLPASAQFSDTFDFLQAVEKNDMPTARRKINEGANVNGRREGMPIFVVALKNGFYDMARLLLDNGAYVNMTSIPNQETALMVVSATGDETGIRLLLEYRPDLNAPDRNGQTALMKAAQSRQTGAARILIEAGADVFQTDYVGRDALQYAQEARARSIIQLLEEAGVN